MLTRSHAVLPGSAAVALAIAVAVACLAAPHAHVAAASHAHAAAPAPALALAALAAGLALLGGRRRRRSAAALALGGLLTVFAFQTALHSVHHLGDPQQESGCAVVGATAHLSGAATPSADLGAPALVSVRAVEAGPAWPVPFQPIRAREGRAPPVPVSA